MHRTLAVRVVALAMCLFASMALGQSTTSADARRELAPSGVLRAAINLGNPVLARREAASGDLRGVSVDLARELARRLSVRLELVTYAAAGSVVEDVRSRAWDVSFLAGDPERAAEIDFTRR